MRRSTSWPARSANEPHELPEGSPGSWFADRRALEPSCSDCSRPVTVLWLEQAHDAALRVHSFPGAVGEVFFSDWLET